jgi:S-formylglutathione hydrolase FrmB
MIKISRSFPLWLLLCLTLSAHAQSAATARVETVLFQSKLIGAALPYNVVLPPGYDAAGRTAYPVIYLLHGLAGHHDNWTSKTGLVSYAAQHRMIIVTPEGNDGWYTDSATVARDKYETYVVRELIPDVERRYRAVRKKQGRAIAGLSMGGYGALKFGLKYPNLFVFAASISGALDPVLHNDAKPGVAWGFVRASILGVFGADDSPVRRDNDLYRMLLAVPAKRISSLPFLYLDCGTEDAFLETNRELKLILEQRKIPHEYRELRGTHEWAYWDRQIRDVLQMAEVRMTVKP